MGIMRNIKGYKRHSLQTVKLSQWTQTAVQIVLNLPNLPFFAMLLTKAGDGETIPGPTTLNK